MMRYNKFNEMRMTDDERREYEIEASRARAQVDIARSHTRDNTPSPHKEKFINHILELLEKDFKLSTMEDKLTSISDYGIKIHTNITLDDNSRFVDFKIIDGNLDCDYYDVNEFESSTYSNLKIQVEFSSKYGIDKATYIHMEQWSGLEKDIKRFVSYCSSIGLEVKNDSCIFTDENPKHPGDFGYVKILVVASKWYKFFDIFPDESNLPEDIGEQILKVCRDNKIGKQGRIDIAKLIKDVTNK